MNKQIESFWDKDLQLHYDICVGIGLIGGQTFSKALNDAESVRKYSKLDLSNKTEHYYRMRYTEYLKRRMEKNLIEKNHHFSNTGLNAETLSDKLITEKLKLAGDLISSINQKEFDNDPNTFYQSLQIALKSVYGEYLSPRSLSSLSKMQTFKVKGVNAGFALAKIKDSSDLMMVAGFNQSGIPGLGTKLIITGIELGGKYLECFGPYLNGYYQSYGFDIYNEIPNVKMRNGVLQTVYCMEQNKHSATNDKLVFRVKNANKGGTSND